MVKQVINDHPVCIVEYDENSYWIDAVVLQMKSFYNLPHLRILLGILIAFANTVQNFNSIHGILLETFMV